MGIEVEGALGRGDAADATLGQRRQQAVAVAAIDRHPCIQLRPVAEGAKRGVLGDGGRSDEEVLGKAGDGIHQILRHHQPSQPPAGHAEIFGEAVDHQGGGLVRQSAGRGAIGDAVIDLIRHDPDAGLGTERPQLGEPFGRDHAAGGIGRARQHQPVQGQRPLEAHHRRLEAFLWPQLEPHHLHIQRPQDVAIGGIARLGQGHPIARIKGGEKAQHEGAGGANGDGDAPRVHLHPIHIEIMLGDALTQGRQAEGLAIAHEGLIEGASGRLQRCRRGAAAGLAQLQMQHLLTRRRPRIGRRQHLHHHEGSDFAAP